MRVTPQVPRVLSWAPAKRLLRHRRLVLMELRNKLVLGHSILAMRRIENAEVERLRRRTAGNPDGSGGRRSSATYKRPELLQRAVRSALAQTVADQLVIVVDDGGGLPSCPMIPDWWHARCRPILQCRCRPQCRDQADPLDLCRLPRRRQRVGT